METVKKTYKDLNALFNKVNQSIGAQETKVQKKLQKFYEKALKPHLDSYNDQLEELRLDNAATDEKGTVLMQDKGGYKFTKEGIKKLNKDADTLNAKEFDYKLIEVLNPQGLEALIYLEGWTIGIDFIKKEEEEEIEL